MTLVTLQVRRVAEKLVTVPLFSGVDNPAFIKVGVIFSGTIEAVRCAKYVNLKRASSPDNPFIKALGALLIPRAMAAGEAGRGLCCHFSSPHSNFYGESA